MLNQFAEEYTVNDYVNFFTVDYSASLSFIFHVHTQFFNSSVDVSIRVVKVEVNSLLLNVELLVQVSVQSTTSIDNFTLQSLHKQELTSNIELGTNLHQLLSTYYSFSSQFVCSAWLTYTLNFIRSDAFNFFEVHHWEADLTNTLRCASLCFTAITVYRIKQANIPISQIHKESSLGDWC